MIKEGRGVDKKGDKILNKEGRRRGGYLALLHKFVVRKVKKGEVRVVRGGVKIRAEWKGRKRREGGG